MAVRFVIGRAGTGKTALCIREIRAEMARDPLGGPLLWIVPEQGTFSAERLILSSAALGAPRGMFRAQVLGFRRLALAIARDTALLAGPTGALAKPMDDIARTVLLEEILRHNREKLTVFRAASDRPGFVTHLDAILRELRQHGHSGASLRELADQRLEPVMTRKLLDLSILLDAWSAELEKSGAWDFEHLMHAAALKAGESPLITGGPAPARVWVDAFSEMSALEIRMLAALGQHARDVTITLLADPDSPTLRAQRRDDADDGLFARPERLHRRLIDEFRRHQVPLSPTLVLRERHRLTAPVLAHLEANLFAAHPQPFAPAPAAAPPGAPERIEAPRLRGKGRAPDQPGLFDTLDSPAETLRYSDAKNEDALPPVFDEAAALELWEAADPECEVRAVARAIRALMLDSADIENQQSTSKNPAPLRCRQIAVIVPDLESYHDAIRRAFADHGIPHFIDLRRGIAHHPLVEFLRSAVAIAAAHWERDDLILYLKTGLAGIARHAVPALENYLIEHAITHVPWEEPWPWLAANQLDDEADADIPAAARHRLADINALRQTVWNKLHPFVEACLAPAPDGAHFARALQDLLARLHVEQALESWAAAARLSGDLEMAQVHEQAGRETARILQLLETLLAGRPRTLGDFQRLLEGALAQLSLGLIPPTLDQVLVSSVARSRVPEMEAVFVLGAVEGKMPQVPQEDPILSDEQRAAFNTHAADPIADGSGRRLLEAAFLDYVAFTRSRRKLVISRPLADGQGGALAPSRHLARLEDLLGPALIRRTIPAGPGDPRNIGTADDLVTHVAAWARQTIATGDPGDGNTPALYNRLLAADDATLSTARRQAWRAIVPPQPPALSPGLAAYLYPAGVPLRLSVSQLERFAACPLQYFMDYTLRLRPREELQLDGRDLGSLQHDILERVYRRIIAGTLDWPDDSIALREAVAAEVDAAAGAMHPELAEHLPGYAKTRARLKRTLGIILEADRRRSAAGYLRPDAVELFFGGTTLRQDPQGRTVALPVLVVPAGTHTAHVSGKIDRIDVTQGDDALAVIDYKSGAGKNVDLARVRHGISLQLPVYALVTAPLDKPAIAALYLNLGTKLARVDSAAAAPAPDSDSFYQQFTPRGMIDALYADRLDGALRPDESGAAGAGFSRWYNATFNQDGTIRKRTDLLPREDFMLVLAHVRATIARLAAGLANGTIAPAPYRHRGSTPCEHCPHAGLCPFDRTSGTYRNIPSQKNHEALAAMRQDFQLPTAHPT